MRRVFLVLLGVTSLALATFAMVVSASQLVVSPDTLPWLQPHSGACSRAAPPGPRGSPCPSLAAQVAPLLPPSGNRLVAAIQADGYYHLLVPLTVPVTLFTVRRAVPLPLTSTELSNSIADFEQQLSPWLCMQVFVNWFSMKLFKHNS